MEKTLEVQLKEQREMLLEEIACDFERKAKEEILSNTHTYNDCAVISKMYYKTADLVRQYK